MAWKKQTKPESIEMLREEGKSPIRAVYEHRRRDLAPLLVRRGVNTRGWSNVLKPILLTLAAMFHWQPLVAAPEGNGVKFGFFDLSYPAAGISKQVAAISPHFRLQFDGDAIVGAPTWLTLDLSFRYLDSARSGVRFYVGGGTGIAIGKTSGIPGHVLGGLQFEIDTIPFFAEIKVHLNSPAATSAWVGIRY